MKTTYLKTNTIENIFKKLKLSFGGLMTKESKEYILEIKNNIGTGTIKGITLTGGISYIEFNMIFSEDVVLSINVPDKTPIYFAYCSKGSLGHSFGVNGKKNVLQSFQTGILTSQSSDENVLYFKKDKHIKVTLITVQANNKATVSENYGLKNKLYKAFFKEGTNKNFIYIGSQNLKIAEKIQQLEAIKQKGLVRSLLIQGLVHVILALEVQQHTDDTTSSENQLGSLLIREVEIIKEASQFIRDHFDLQLSITQLCSKFGIAPSKLQEGFKSMHNHTVADFIREVRIQKAEEFIKNTDMNISEVVYSIGFSSRSYFSKIFREKYNCSPSKYKNANRVSSFVA
ncbi:AraC family transcriptional regulator [Flavivirga sp. 57AJ16]|uniref:helix-turn-helix domain-containing protein n=1 Tax=Flavivirga sp. 57AJ16 TaxID=3025307 RepID=UPI0023667FE8|nr:AraC family transcriptional regulator [Flavivirga sp. 57AJ16]MDD7886588.1 AraC family transcriptional regulator [Flavivirga sp. 57AJ16]